MEFNPAFSSHMARRTDSFGKLLSFVPNLDELLQPGAPHVGMFSFVVF